MDQNKISYLHVSESVVLKQYANKKFLNKASKTTYVGMSK